LLPEAPLSLCGAPTVKMTGLTIDTVVDFWDIPTMVIAFNMLPRFATLAEDCIPIIIFERTNAFDGIRLLLFSRDRI
jgi:hypothetical protein